MALWTLAFLGPRAFAGVVDGALADGFGVPVATLCLAAAPLAAAMLLRHVQTPTIEPIPPPA
jgi:hypothetical protein